MLGAKMAQGVIAPLFLKILLLGGRPKYIKTERDPIIKYRLCDYIHILPKGMNHISLPKYITVINIHRTTWPPAPIVVCIFLSVGVLKERITFFQWSSRRSREAIGRHVLPPILVLSLELNFPVPICLEYSVWRLF